MYGPLLHHTQRDTFNSYKRSPRKNKKNRSPIMSLFVPKIWIFTGRNNKARANRTSTMFHTSTTICPENLGFTRQEQGRASRTRGTTLLPLSARSSRRSCETQIVHEDRREAREGMGDGKGRTGVNIKKKRIFFKVRLETKTATESSKLRCHIGRCWGDNK